MTEMPRSLWAATAVAPVPAPALDGPAETGCVVVGAGYTGLSAALHLVAAGIDTTVLDAGEPGWGCSGRNGGQVNPGGSKVLPDELDTVLGPEWGPKFRAFGDRTCDLVFDLVERHDIDCDALRPGYVQGRHGAHGLAKQTAWVEQWNRTGVGARLLDRDEMAAVTGTAHYHGGMLDPRGGSLQPLSYARGLARAAVALGATLHGASTAARIERRGAGWRVHTRGGYIDAPKVVLATNGYTDDLWPGLRRSVVPVASYVAATAPLGNNVLASVLPGRHAVSESADIGYYYRLDRDGRFVIGGRGNWTNVSHEGDDGHVRAAAARLFPQIEGVEWTHHWAGWPAITTDRLPKLFALAKGVFASLGYNGRGVALGTAMGRQLALAVAGEPTEVRVEPLRTVAFHAFRQVGITWHLLTGSLADRGRRRASP